MKKPLLIWLLALTTIHPSWSQPSVAHQWMNDLLFCITNDFARPPIHARNLHHLSIVMHDAFAAYKPGTKTILLNNDWNGFQVPFYGVAIPNDVEAAQEIAVSFAAYRLLAHRFQNAPGVVAIFDQLNSRMFQLNLDANFTSTDYITHGAPALGNYIAQQMIAYGFQDGSNEMGNYANQYYTNGNPVIEPELPGNPNMINPNRFQRISLSNAIDQAGNPIVGAPPALAHEWGNVKPFSLKQEDSEVLERDGEFYKVYFNPDHPPYIDTNVQTGLEDFFKWNFLMVSVWQSHLDTLDNVLWDVSPGAIGNVDQTQYPETWADYQNFYDFYDGGDVGQGYAINPVTNQAYEPQLVRRGDYARVLAEFWADGLDSETPPGHWFKIYNEISTHPLFVRKWKGEGDELSHLEYDVKAYLLLGGTMHDAAIAAWAVKGYYDYLRPVSAIRFMGDRGQSSDPDLPNYHPAGLPLIPGFVELVDESDPLAGNDLEHLHKIKLYTWRGHDFVDDPHTDMAGVGWILAENWWPYQRPTFVTPPFAGYVSGHSTYSRAAAKAMHFLTGTPYFPGGMSNFTAEQNEFLEFEIGPSQTVVLQWATYYDASDQCSLSRIWGGIHPPIDDIPGRKIGQKVGEYASEKADSLVSISPPQILNFTTSLDSITSFSIGQNLNIVVEFDQDMNPLVHPELIFHSTIDIHETLHTSSGNWTSSTAFEFEFLVLDNAVNVGMLPFSVIAALNENGVIQNPKLFLDHLFLDTKKPTIVNLVPSQTIVTSQTNQICVALTLDEPCDTTNHPVFTWTGFTNANDILLFVPAASGWTNNQTFTACFDVAPQANPTFADLSLSVQAIFDLYGNPITDSVFGQVLLWDIEQPVLELLLNDDVLNIFDVGAQALIITVNANKAMNTSGIPVLTFMSNQDTLTSIFVNTAASMWLDQYTCSVVVTLTNTTVNFSQVAIYLSDVFDESGNPPVNTVFENQFVLDTRRPEIELIQSSILVINDHEVVNNQFHLDLHFDETMDVVNFLPVVSIRDNDNTTVPGISYNIFSSEWQDENTYRARFNLLDMNMEVNELFAQVSQARDVVGNPMLPLTLPISVWLDTKNPKLVAFEISHVLLNENTPEVTITSVFDEPMHEDYTPNYLAHTTTDELELFSHNSGQWINSTTYQGTYWVTPFYYEGQLSLQPFNGFDGALNPVQDTLLAHILEVDFLYLSTVSQTGNELAPLVYPNPVTLGQHLRLYWDKSTTLSSYEVLDMLGRSVFYVDVSSDFDGTLSAIQYLSAGTYILKLYSTGHNQLVRFQVQH